MLLSATVIRKFVLFGKDKMTVDTIVADLGSFAFLTLGSGMGKNSGSGSGMNNQDHIFERLRNQIFGLKNLNSLMRIWDGKYLDPG